MIKYHLLFLFIFSSVQYSFAQEEREASKKVPPPLKLTRAEESYLYLKEKESNPFESSIFDGIKFIPLSPNGNINLSLGGQYRTRYEHYSNRFWNREGDQNFYSQRIAFHTNLELGKYIRFFGELYHGYTSHEKEFAEYDEADIFQAFVEFKSSIGEEGKINFRFGRQEMGLGATRLIGIREGPNIRRSYDMGRIIYSKGKSKIQAFYGKEIRPLFGAFDNEFSFFDSSSPNPKLWGAYSQFPINGLNGFNEFYYLGFQVDNSAFNDVSGEETRHTIGLRRFGKIGKHWRYNSEAIYQFGEIDGQEISAFSIDTDWHYELNETNWKWSPGLKLEYTSGDKDTGDGKINSFNPMFVNPAFYSLAATVTPVNIIGIHPSVRFKPTEKLRLYAEWAIFWRASKNDALYRPTRFINRPANEVSEKNIGNQFGLEIQYEISRYFSLDFDVSYFIAGNFLEKSGEAENILHIAPTLNFKF